MATSTFVRDVATQAEGHWPSILAGLFINVPARKQHGPCPVCGGVDRFKFDDKEGRGTWFCNQCEKQAGDGLDLVARAFNKPLKEAAELVAPLVGMTGAGLDPAERARREKELVERAAKEKRDADIQRRKAADRAAAIMRDREHGVSQYLEGKGLHGVTSRITQTVVHIGDVCFPPGSLIVPLHNEARELVNVQLVSDDGEKRYLSGGQKQGAFYLFHGSEPAAICEGYATGLSYHSATGHAVYCAMDAGNLPTVASMVRGSMGSLSTATIILAADNDASGAGLTAAKKAAAATGGIVVMPPELGDWNDYHQAHGLEATKAEIMRQIEQTKEASQKKALPLEGNVVALRPVPADASTQDLDPDTLSKMPANKLGRIIAELLGTSAVCRESGIVYRYGDGVWLPVSDARLAPMLAEVFDHVGATYTAKKLNGAVETMKVGLPEMEAPTASLIGFANGVYDLKACQFRDHSPSDHLPSHNGIEYGEPLAGETLERHAPNFIKWLSHAAGGDPAKMDRIKAALFMVLANRYDWQMFLEVTGEGGSGKSVMANLCEFLVGKENVGSTSMEAMRGSFGLENVWDKRLILLPDQSQYIGDGALLKAITGGDEVSINRKNKAQFNAKVRAVVIATNNEPMKMTERNGGISRRRVIFAFNNVVSEANKDPALGDKIAAELPVIIRHLLAQFADPEQARQLLLEQRDGAEALAVKQEADPVIAMCALLEFLSETTGLRVGGGNGVHDPVRFLYHFYLEYLKAEGLDRPLHRTAFGKAMKAAAKAYGEEYQTRKSNGDRVTNVKLKDEAHSVLPQARLLDD